jgi:flavodoxin
MSGGVMKCAIVYCSHTGFTAELAKNIGEVLEADLIELRTREPLIPNKMTVKNLVTGGSQVVLKKKPELEKYEFNQEEYDLIILGTPVWAWTFAPPMRTFLTEHDLEGKKVALFATHHGKPGNTLKNMAQQLPKASIISSRDFLNDSGKKASSKSNARLWGASLQK